MNSRVETLYKNWLRWRRNKAIKNWDKFRRRWYKKELDGPVNSFVGRWMGETHYANKVERFNDELKTG